MTDKEYWEKLEKLEKQEELLTKQIELRDKLIIRLLTEVEPLCEECALKSVCATGAKYETCARGLLAELQR